MTTRSLSLIVLACLGLAVLSWPPSHADAQVVIRQVPTTRTYSTEPVEPPPYHAPERHGGGHPLWGLFVPAIALFGVTWLSTPLVTAAVGGDGGEIGINAIPLAGPWICFSACERPGPYAWSLILSGTLQAVTTILWIIGAAVQVGGDDDSAMLEHDGVRVTPWASQDGGGLALRGLF